MNLQRLGIFAILSAAAGLAQEPPPPPQPPQPAQAPRAARPMVTPFTPQPPQPPQPPRRVRPPMERALGGPAGRWWTRPEMAQRLGLTADQKGKMDDIFQQNRLKLIDLNAVVQKEEAIMEPLVSAEQPDESRIVAQIDKVAQARAELEKANARMLLGIRRVLTADQWEKLKAEQAPQGIVGGMAAQPATPAPPPPPRRAPRRN